MAEFVVRRCVAGGTGCGGSVLVGKEGELEMVVGYYTLRGGKVVARPVLDDAFRGNNVTAAATAAAAAAVAAHPAAAAIADA